MRVDVGDPTEEFRKAFSNVPRPPQWERKGEGNLGIRGRVMVTSAGDLSVQTTVGADASQPLQAMVTLP